MNTFAELSGREKGVEVLRWIGVVPVAVAGGLATQMVVSGAMRLAMNLGLVTTDAVGLSYFFKLIIWYTPKYVAFVIAGAMVAPRLRRAAAIVLAAAGVLFSLTVHVFVQIHPGWANFMHVAFESTGSIGGAAYILYLERQRKRAN